MENEEKLSDDVSENDIREASSKENSDDDIESSFQVVDSWEDKDSDTERSGEKRAVEQLSTTKSVDNEEEVPAKRPKLVEVDEDSDDDSDDDFAAQLLEGQDRNSLKQIYTEFCNFVWRR